MLAGDMALRSPLQTINLTWQLVTQPQHRPHIEETMRAFVLAVFFAISIGLATGLVFGFSKFAGDIFEPILVALYSIPKLTLYPILLLSFGLGMSAKVAFGAIHGIIPIALFTIE